MARAIHWYPSVARFRGAHGRFVSRDSGLRSSVARAEFLEAQFSAAEVGRVLSKSVAEFFGVERDIAYKERKRVPAYGDVFEAEGPEPITRIISEIGAPTEEELEFELEDREGGDFEDYLDQYIYDRDDFDEDQDDPYDF